VGIVESDPQVLGRFVASPGGEGPIIMINLLRYLDAAAYPPGFDATPCSGREAYRRYGERVTPLIAKAGGRPIWLARVNFSPLAAEGETWDDAVLVEYPSRRAFLDMISSPEYQAAAVHRTASLADSRLIETETVFRAKD